MKHHHLMGAIVCALLSGPASAGDPISLDGFYECTNATNGKAYCKRLGQGDHYFLVSDAFLLRYRQRVASFAQETTSTRMLNQETTTSTRTTGQETTSTRMLGQDSSNEPASTNGNVGSANAGSGNQAPSSAPVNQSSTVVALKSDASETRGLMMLFQQIIEEQRKVAVRPDESDVAQQSIAVLTNRVKELEGQFREKTIQLSAYTTAIRPNDPDLQITARRASELFPKIPYYIPGTPETGEFWLEPTVSDVGDLLFNFKIIDPASKDRVREMIGMSSAQLEMTRDALRKVVDWSKTAHDNRIRRDFSRRAVCFPTEDCPAEGAKRDKVASTEIVFRVYEDGSTAGRIQRNKGRFESGYNISVDSALLLQAYLNHILLEGKTEFNAGSRDTEQLRDLFK